jgi:flavodoxin
MPKSKKALLMYQTLTGNTVKIVDKFKEVFEKKGWECDVVKIEKTSDLDNPPVDFYSYDFVCMGSGVYGSLPGNELWRMLFRATHHTNKPGKKPALLKKIVPGPKSGVVFVTYGGAHLGPQEAEPALSLLALMIEHLKFKCIGKFACPGKMREYPTPGYWHGDLRFRPSERDIKKAETFLEEKLEEID